MIEDFRNVYNELYADKDNKEQIARVSFYTISQSQKKKKKTVIKTIKYFINKLIKKL